VEHIGIDVHKKESQICILGEDGQGVVERRVRTEGDRLAAVLGGKAKSRVLIEARRRVSGLRAASKPLGTR